MPEKRPTKEEVEAELNRFKKLVIADVTSGKHEYAPDEFNETRAYVLETVEGFKPHKAYCSFCQKEKSCVGWVEVRVCWDCVLKELNELIDIFKNA